MVVRWPVQMGILTELGHLQRTMGRGIGQVQEKRLITVGAHELERFLRIQSNE